MTTITLQRKAYCYGALVGPDSSIGRIAMYASFWDEAPGTDYVEFGTAEITLTLHDRKTITVQAVATLRAEAEKLRAETGAKLTEIDRQINELLAIENGA